MTPTQFINTESLRFQPGQLVVVSGPDNGIITTLLMNTRDAIRGRTIGCLDPVDTRTTVAYPTGLVGSDLVPTATRFRAPMYRNTKFIDDRAIQNGLSITFIDGVNIGTTRTISAYDPVSQIVTVSTPWPLVPVIGDGFSVGGIIERPYNFEFLVIDNPHSVILASNQFDRESFAQNPHPADIQIDVIIDLLNVSNVNTIPDEEWSRYGFVREIFGYISFVYYYDTRLDEITFVKTQIPERGFGS